MFQFKNRVRLTFIRMINISDIADCSTCKCTTQFNVVISYDHTWIWISTFVDVVIANGNGKTIEKMTESDACSFFAHRED